jgi:hypothetical protein
MLEGFFLEDFYTDHFRNTSSQKGGFNIKIKIFCICCFTINRHKTACGKIFREPKEYS